MDLEKEREVLKVQKDLERITDANGNGVMFRYEIQNKNSKAITKVVNCRLPLCEVIKPQYQDLMRLQRITEFDKYFPLNCDIKPLAGFNEVADHLIGSVARKSVANDMVLWWAHQQGVSFDLIETALRTNGFSRTAISKFRKKITRVTSITPNGDLYHELKTKIANDKT